MLVFKYYIYVPSKSVYDINSKGDIFEYTCFPTDEDVKKFKLTPFNFLRSKKLRKQYYDFLTEEVNNTIVKNHKGKYVWWSVNVFDEDANYLFTYGKNYNKKLVS